MTVLWNASDKGSTVTLENSDLEAVNTQPAQQSGSARATHSETIAVGKKRYIEFKALCPRTTAFYVGLVTASFNVSSGSMPSTSGACTYQNVLGGYWHNGYLGNKIQVVENDIIRFAIDGAKFWIGVNSTWVDSGNPATGANPLSSDLTGTLFPCVSPYDPNSRLKILGDSDSFVYAAPAGFLPWGIDLTSGISQHRASFAGLVLFPVRHRSACAGLLSTAQRAGFAGLLTAPQATGFAGFLLPAQHRAWFIGRMTAQHRTGFGARLTAPHHTDFAGLSQSAARHRTGFAGLERTALTIRHRVGFAGLLSVPHRAGVAGPIPMTVLHRAAFGSTTFLTVRHRASFTGLVYNPLVVPHRASFAGLVPQSQVIAGVVQLRPVGTGQRAIALESATLHCDAGSPYWQADLTLANARDYARCRLDMLVDLEVHGSPYRLLVDDRQLSRGSDTTGNPQESATLKCLSPSVQYDSPRASPITKTWGAVSAQQAAEEAIGAGIDWDIYDWWIPAGRLAVTDATPIAVVKQIIEAIGGVLESKPDGTLRARYRYPVRVADLRRVEPDLSLTEHNIYSVSETRTASKLIDRLRIVDVESTFRDRLEWEPDEADGRKGRVRAFPAPWRDQLTLTHTRDGPVHLYSNGEVLLVKTETVEIVAGTGSVQYPILSIQSTAYLADNLGAVSFSPFSTQVVTAVSGYSLLQVTYTTKALEYRAESELDTKAQILLEDAG